MNLFTQNKSLAFPALLSLFPESTVLYTFIMAVTIGSAVCLVLCMALAANICLMEAFISPNNIYLFFLLLSLWLLLWALLVSRKSRQAFQYPSLPRLDCC